MLYYLDLWQYLGKRQLGSTSWSSPMQFSSQSSSTNILCIGFTSSSMVKNLPAHAAGDMDSIPGLGRSPEEGNDSPFQYSCLGSPTDRGTWRATAHGVAKE